MNKVQDFLTEARSFIGTKFHHQGRVKGAGVDCVGLIVSALKNTCPGEPVPDLKTYNRRPDGRLLKRLLDATLWPVDMENLKSGDALLFNINGVVPQHVGIITRVSPNPRMLHAYSVARKVTEHSIGKQWWDRSIQGYRLPWLYPDDPMWTHEYSMELNKWL